MTTFIRPTITDEQVERMDPFEAFRYAEGLLDSRMPREALRMMRPVVAAEPDNAAAWELLGRAHFAAAHLQRAEEAFRRLIELEPSNAWAHTALGLSLDRQSRHAEGATQHRLAQALGAEPVGSSRIEIVERDPGRE